MRHHDIRAAVHAIWEELRKAGLSEPADIIEQMLTLLFLRRRDDVHAHSARGPRRTPDGVDDPRLHWSSFKDLDDGQMYALLTDHV